LGTREALHDPLRQKASIETTCMVNARSDAGIES
jgi:hypothetical protein